MNVTTMFVQHKAETVYMNMDESMAEILLSNTVDINEGNDYNEFITKLPKSRWCFIRITVLFLSCKFLLSSCGGRTLKIKEEEIINFSKRCCPSIHVLPLYPVGGWSLSLLTWGEAE